MRGFLLKAALYLFSLRVYKRRGFFLHFYRPHLNFSSLGVGKFGIAFGQIYSLIHVVCQNVV